MIATQSNEYEALLQNLAKRYMDPVFFTEHGLGIYTWSKMREIMISVLRNKNTGVKACHGSSKTKTASIIAIWFLNMFLQAKVITTAPTYTQVKHLLWSEINTGYMTSRIKLIGDCQETAIKTDDPGRFAIGFSTNEPARAEGWHSPQILFILDEAKGIPHWFWNSVKGSMTSGYARILAISTTDGVQAGEMFHNIFTNPRYKKQWNTISMDVFDLPEFTGEKLRRRNFETGAYEYITIKKLGAQLSGKEWEKECRELWGEDSVLYKTKVRGEIVDETPDSIIKLSQVLKAFKNYEDPGFDDTGSIAVGVDVARMGDDSSYFYKRKGQKIIDKASYNKTRLTYLADKLEEFVGFKKNLEEVRIKIDDTGVGGGLTDIMIERGYKNIFPVNFNQKAQNPDLYINAISEMWFTCADLIESYAVPEDEELKAQLVNRRKLPLDSQGRRRVEKKEDYKKRFGGKSPDNGDAFLLCINEFMEGASVYLGEGSDEFFKE